MIFRDALTTACIAATSLTAGSIFCFPLFGPSLTHDLGLNLTQTNTIWVGAVLGEYLSAAVWGALADVYGPRLLSLAAAFLFAAGYQLMAHADVVADSSIVVGPEGGRQMATKSFVLTVASFVGIGSGVAASYFAAVTASTRLFKSHPGMAIAVPLTLFSLSSLFLTSVGVAFFTDAETDDFNAPAFLSFLGILLGLTNLLATVFMRAPSADSKPRARAEATQPDEQTRLLPPAEDGEGSRLGDPEQARFEAAQDVEWVSTVPGVSQSQTTMAFLSSPAVWTLSLLMVVGVGASEMVFSSVGNMVVSLLGTSSRQHALAGGPIAAIGPVALRIRADQVKLLAAANTISRLTGGIVSDMVAPQPGNAARTEADADADGDGEESGAGRVRRGRYGIPQISRLSFLLMAVTMLFGAFSWAAFGMTSTDGLPAFSVIVGSAYGFIFTLTPAVTVSAFGTKHFGRNWGLLSYCCALGSLSYSLLYAVISDAVARREGQHGPDGGNGSDGGDGSADGGATCLAGPACFRPSFIASAIGCLLAFGALLPVWRRWRRYL